MVEGPWSTAWGSLHSFELWTLLGSWSSMWSRVCRRAALRAGRHFVRSVRACGTLSSSFDGLTKTLLSKVTVSQQEERVQHL